MHTAHVVVSIEVEEFCKYGKMLSIGIPFTIRTIENLRFANGRCTRLTCKTLQIQILESQTKAVQASLPAYRVKGSWNTAIGVPADAASH
jgi:hypothetical protein